jgi:hypothetical protein
MPEIRSPRLTEQGGLGRCNCCVIPTRLAVLVVAFSMVSSRAIATPEPIEIPVDIARDFRVEIDPETGCVALLHAWWGDPMIFGHEGCASRPLRDHRLIDRARDFFWSHADLFGLRRTVDDLTLSSAYECLGSFYVDFDRRYQGVRIFGAGAHVRFAHDGRIEAVGAACVPGIEIETVPRISRDEAALIAAKAVRGAIPGGTKVEARVIRRRRDLPESPASKTQESRPDDFLLIWPVVV